MNTNISNDIAMYIYNYTKQKQETQKHQVPTQTHSENTRKTSQHARQTPKVQIRSKDKINKFYAPANHVKIFRHLRSSESCQ